MEQDLQPRSAEVSPWSLPRRDLGWVLYRVIDEVAADHLSLVAGGVAFFGFLSVFPALAALVAGYGLLFDAPDVTKQMMQLRVVLPESMLGLLEDQLGRLASAAPESLSFGGVVALAVALWSANRGSRGMIEAINIACDRRETRGIVRRTVLGLAMTTGSIVFVIVAVALVAVVPAWLSWAGLDMSGGHWVAMVRWPMLVAVVLVSVATVYHVAPDRAPRPLRWLTPGTTLVTGVLLAASGLFSLYVSSFGHYNEVYGSLGAVAVFLLWLYLVSLVVLLGAELDAVIERRLAWHERRQARQEPSNATASNATTSAQNMIPKPNADTASATSIGPSPPRPP